MPTQLTEARPTGEWTQVFEQMQETLAQTIATTPEVETVASGAGRRGAGRFTASRRATRSFAGQPR